MSKYIIILEYIHEDIGIIKKISNVFSAIYLPSKFDVIFSHFYTLLELNSGKMYTAMSTVWYDIARHDCSKSRK